MTGQPHPPTTLSPLRARSQVKVVLFSGGSGAQELASELAAHPQVRLTLAINGYDDGASTGAIRRFLGAMLGPSDYRKNAALLCRQLHGRQAAIADLLDLRLPSPCTTAEGLACLGLVGASRAAAATPFQIRLASLAASIEAPMRGNLADCLEHFARQVERLSDPFPFADCNLGNLVFAGCFLQSDRDFNKALHNFCTLLALPEGLIENATTGTDAYLVALTRDGRLLVSEAEIVDASRRNYIDEIFLLDHRPTAEQGRRLEEAGAGEIVAHCAAHAVPLEANPRLLARLEEADLIIYGPGTQHSSLFPTYLTPGIGEHIAANLGAIKLFITNIREDAEIPEHSAVELIDRAVYYLRRRNALKAHLPCLITHYLINDPGRADEEAAYVPLGRLEAIEDPRLVRIADYEKSGTGRHDARRVLVPFVESVLSGRRTRRVAVLLLATDSPDRICQSLLELLRLGLPYLEQTITVYHASREPLEPLFAARLPFAQQRLAGLLELGRPAFLCGLAGEGFDYAVLFDSSGTYRGEDIAAIASLLTNERLDAVWGSRRLSIRDIHQSYRRRYRRRRVRGALSYLGSHLLSLAYLLLYGRYVSDTLSGVCAVRTRFLREIDLNHPCASQHLLSALMRQRAELIETPVPFFTPHREDADRHGVLAGMRALLAIFWGRLRP